MHWILVVLAVFCVSTLLCGIIIPQILLIAFRKHLFDEPDERKIHKVAIPRLGGMAFMPSLVFSLCLVSGIVLLTGESYPDLSSISVGAVLKSQTVESHAIPLCFGLCSIMLMYVVGLADDLIGVKYRAKFVAQILAGLLLAMGGVRLDSLHGMLGIGELPMVLSYMLTVLLVVFIVNAINLIDGIDGLASGLSGIAMAFYGFVLIAAGQWVYALIAFAGLGTLVPFFYYNVFGNAAKHKKIFMGDTGSLTTGIVLSFLAMEISNLPTVGVFQADVLVLAFAPLAVPALDVVRVFVHRILRGNSPFLPDRCHIHHKLLALNIRQRVAMISILGSSAGLVALDMVLSPAVGPFMILVIDLIIWVVANYLLTRTIRARQRRGEPSARYD